MARHADYEIKIKDPKTGTCEHEVLRYRFGNRKKLNPLDEIFYRTTRLFKRTRANKPYTDLDFFISKKKSTALMFEITAEGWFFDKNKGSISYDSNAPKGIKTIKSTDKHLHVEVPGARRTGKEEEFKYSLHYIDPDKKEFEFDPIINNGSIPPSFTIAPMVLKITLLSTVLSVIMTAFMVAMLIKFNII